MNFNCLHKSKFSYPKALSVIFFVGLFLAYIYAFANPPASPYKPGVTLDPTCAPMSSNCYVEIIPDPAGHAAQVLTSDGSSMFWGVSSGSSQWVTTGSDIYYNTGNVGIGTNTPSTLLSIQKDSIGQNNIGGLLLSNTTPATAISQYQNSPAIIFHASGFKSSVPGSGSRITDWSIYAEPIPSNGGIGSRLYISNSINGGAYDKAAYFEDAGLLWLDNQLGFFGSSPSITSTLNQITITSPGILYSSSDGSPFTVSGGDLITDRIGIGNPTPSVALDVVGYSRFTSSVSSTNIFSVNKSNGDDVIRVNEDNQYVLLDGPQNGYKVGIGTSSPTSTLDVAGDINVIGVGSNSGITTSQLGLGVTAIGDFNVNANGTRIVINDTTTQGIQYIASGKHVFNGAVQMQQYGAGTATFDASGNITSSSDERLKDIQGNYTPSLSELMNINPILYKWNSLSKLETQNTYAGFSAQNVQASLPYAVGQGSNGYLTLQDRAITATLVNAVKEMNIKITELNDFTKENTWRDSLIAWLSNATNHITRIFTGEICLSDQDGTSECINKTELHNLKQLLNTLPPTGGSGGSNLTPPIDICPNIDGNQSSIPDGIHIDAQNNCVANDVPPVDADNPPTDNISPSN